MIRVFDLDRSIDFYTRLMGMKLLRKREVADGPLYPRLRRLWRRGRRHGARAHLQLGPEGALRDRHAASAISRSACRTSTSSASALAKEGVKIPRPPGPLKFGTVAHRLHRGPGRLQDRADPASRKPVSPGASCLRSPRQWRVMQESLDRACRSRVSSENSWLARRPDPDRRMPRVAVGRLGFDQACRSSRRACGGASTARSSRASRTRSAYPCACPVHR